MDAKQIEKVTELLRSLSLGLRSLEEAGRGIPAVEANTVRLKGTLNALEIQFQDLAAL